ncbi:hypothetical protein JGU66_07145 [Myxococcaceae bacterium JPH2]|nr:hypothetical protein [Myxococcaceae bacterium JPH2]
MSLSSSSHTRRALLVVAGWAVALLVSQHPVIFSGLRLMQGDEGDVRFNHYVLEHGWRHVTGAPADASFWDPNMFHPAPNAAAYSDVLLGVAPAYWVWRAVGLDEDLAWQAWCLTMASLNFLVAAWCLARPLGLRLGPSVMGAILFTIGASRINQANHPQLIAQFYPLLAIAAVLALLRPEMSRRQGIPWAALLVGSGVAQLYAGFYWGWFLFFFLLLSAIVALCLRDLRPRLLSALRTHAPALVLFGVVGLAVLAPLVLHSRQVIREVGLRDFSEAQSMIPRFWSWFYLGQDSWLYGWTNPFVRFQRLPVPWEQRLGLGLITTGVAAVGLWKARSRPGIRLLMLVTVVTILLSTRYAGGIMPWELIFHVVPGASAIRAVARMGLWLLVPASVGLALFLQRQWEAGRVALAVGLGALCLLEQGLTGPTFDRFASRAAIRALAARIPSGCDSFIYTPTSGDWPFWRYQVDAIWAAMESGVPTVNGYSGNVPRGWRLEDTTRFDASSAARLDAALEDWVRARGLSRERICRIESQ